MRNFLFSFFSVAAVVLVSCSDDDVSNLEFASVYSELNEDSASPQISIPLRGSGSLDGVEVTFSGSATLGEDFQLVSKSNEAIIISLINDDDFEEVESVVVRLSGSGLGGNRAHEIVIFSDCDYDPTDYNPDFFGGSWFALEDYGGGATYGPYEVTFVQNSGNENRYDFNDFYDSNCNAYLIFDGSNTTVSFPNQSPCGSALTNSSGTFDVCAGTLTVNVTYDGGPWVYRFSRTGDFD